MTKQMNLVFVVVSCIASSLSFEGKSQTAPKTVEPLQKEKPAKGYLIANFTVRDSVTFQKYRDATAGLAQKDRGKMIMRDINSKTVEGIDPKQIMAIIEFPSFEDAEAYYNSPEYTRARKFGMASADRVIILAKGIPQAVRVSSGQPKGYLVANFTIHDPELFKRYMEAGSPLVAEYNGKAIVYDVNAKIVEGHAKQIVAVMEFASLADVERFYNSPGYQAARKFRVASSQCTVVLGEGVIENPEKK